MAEDIILRLKGEDVSASAVLRAVTAEAERLGVTLEQVSEAGSGGGGLAKMADDADVLGYSIEQATQATDDIADSFGNAGDAAERALDAQLVREFAQGVEGLDDGLKEIPASWNESEEAIKRNQKEVRNLRDIIKNIDPEIARAVLRWASAVTAVGLVSKAVEGVGDNLEEWMLKLGATNESAEFHASVIRDIAQPWKILTGNSEAYTAWLELASVEGGKILQQTTEQANASEVLAKFTEQHKAALEGVKKETEEIAAKEKARADALADLQKQATGFDTAGLNAEISTIIDLWEQVGQKADGAIGEALRDRAAKAQKALSELGANGLSTDLLNKFSDLRERIGGSAEETEKLAKAQEAAAAAAKKQAEAQAPLKKAIEGTTESLRDEAEALRDVRSEALRAEGDLLSQATDIQERIEAALSPDTSGLRKLREEIEELEERERDLATAFEQSDETWQERQRVLDEIAEKTAKLRDMEFGAMGIDNEALDKALDDWRKLLDAADARLQELPESARGAAENIVARFRAIGDNVSALDIRDFKTEFAGAMAVARLEVGRLEDQAKVMADKINEVMAKFQDDMVKVADTVTKALREGPLAALSDIQKGIEAITAAAPALEEAYS